MIYTSTKIPKVKINTNKTLINNVLKHKNSVTYTMQLKQFDTIDF